MDPNSSPDSPNEELSDRATTVADYLEAWLNVSAFRVRESTARSYRSYVRTHLIPGLGAIVLEELTPLHVEQFERQKLEEGVSPATVAHAVRVLSVALGRAVRHGTLTRNPAKLADRVKVPSYRHRTLCKEDVRAMLDGSRDHQLGPLLAVAVTTGARQGELLGLQWADVDLTGRTVSIRRTLVRSVRGKPVYGEPKTGRSLRTLPLSDLTSSAFELQRQLQLQQRSAAGGDWQDHNLVFASSRGTPMLAWNVTHRFQRLLTRLGLPRVRFHDLRHTYTTLLLAQNVQPRVLSENLGHSQIGITLDIYAHVLPATQMEAAAAMDLLLSADRGKCP